MANLASVIETANNVSPSFILVLTMILGKYVILIRIYMLLDWKTFELYRTILVEHYKSGLVIKNFEKKTEFNTWNPTIRLRSLRYILVTQNFVLMQTNHRNEV